MTVGWFQRPLVPGKGGLLRGSERLPSIASSKALPTPRVVWVIADEWDYRLTFEARDPTLELPQIDQLRAMFELKKRQGK